MTLLLLISTILLDAISDGLMQTKKFIGHPVKAVCIAIWVWLFTHGLQECTIFDYIYILIACALMRHGLFDYTRNLAAGQPFLFCGSTSFYDKYIARSVLGVWPARLFCLVSGFVMIYKLIY